MSPKRSSVSMAVCITGIMVACPAGVDAGQRSSRATVVRPVFYVAPLAGPRFFHPGYFHPFTFGPYPYPYHPYGWRRLVFDTTGAARLRVSPSDAEVYVNGYFVGTVNNFDGYFQRLRLPAGEHELAFHLEGYRTLRHRVLFRPGATLSIVDTLEPLAPGEAAEPRPTPDPTARPRPTADPRGRPAPSYGPRERSLYGSLSIRVQPADAQVLVDGEPWDRPEGESRLVIDLAEGPHHVEIRREGYRTYTTTVQIRRGEMLTLNVSLTEGS